MCRKTKLVRDIQAVLQKEEDLQRLEELANAEAMATEAAADVQDDTCDVQAAPSMDLCSTEEMLQVFHDRTNLEESLCPSQVAITIEVTDLV